MSDSTFVDGFDQEKFEEVVLSALALTRQSQCRLKFSEIMDALKAGKAFGELGVEPTSVQAWLQEWGISTAVGPEMTFAEVTAILLGAPGFCPQGLIRNSLAPSTLKKGPLPCIHRGRCAASCMGRHSDCPLGTIAIG